jgi:hypothetical protein
MVIYKVVERKHKINEKSADFKISNNGIMPSHRKSLIGSKGKEVDK